MVKLILIRKRRNVSIPTFNFDKNILLCVKFLSLYRFCIIYCFSILVLCIKSIFIGSLYSTCIKRMCNILNWFFWVYLCCLQEFMSIIGLYFLESLFSIFSYKPSLPLHIHSMKCNLKMPNFFMFELSKWGVIPIKSQDSVLFPFPST